MAAAVCAALAPGALNDIGKTPGDVRTTVKVSICGTKTTTLRNVTAATKKQAFANYGLTNKTGWCKAAGCEVDHLISLELGGTNNISNLWPQPYAGEWNAHQKDKLENPAPQIDLQRGCVPRRGPSHHLARLDQRIQNLHPERPTLKENTMTTIEEVAASTEKVIETVMKVEPTIVGISSMFVPGAGPVLALVQPWVMTAVPYIEKALNDIASGNNSDLFSAFIELLQHVSKGGPNSPILSGPAVTTSTSTDPSAVGSG